MFPKLPRAGFSCGLMLLIAASSISAQDSESRSTYQWGGFKLGVVKIQDEAVTADKACEISIALNCDGQVPFISCFPQLVNLFGNSAEEDGQVMVVASGCDEKCCQGQAAEEVNCGAAGCQGCCAAPALITQVNSTAESCKSCCHAASGSCSTVSRGSCRTASPTQPGIQVSQLLTNETFAGCKACPQQATSNCASCPAQANQCCQHNEMVRLVSHVEASAMEGPTQQQLMNGLMEASVENARLQMQLEAMKHHCGMIEEMAELRARNEWLEEMAELRIQNVELQVRLEMQERHNTMAPHAQMHSGVGAPAVSMPRMLKARAVRISTPLDVPNINLSGSPELIAVPLTPTCTTCPNCPNQGSVDAEKR